MDLFKESRTIWRYLRPYKRRVYFIGSIAIAGSLIAAFIPYLYGRLVDIAISETSTLEIIGGILLLWLVLSLIRNWADRFADNRGWLLARDLDNDLIIEGGSHLLDLPLSYHKHHKMGEIVQRINNGGNYLGNIVSNVVFRIGPSFLTIIFALIVMSTVEWRLALVLLIVLALYSLATVWKTHPLVGSQKKYNKIYEKAYGDLYDSIMNIQTVKSCSREELEKKKMSKNFRTNIAKQFKIFSDGWKDLEFWQQTIFSLGFVIIFGWGVLLLRAKTISTGNFIMFVGYVYLAYSPFAMLAAYYRQIRVGLTAIQRVIDLSKVKTEPYKRRKIELEDVKGAIEFQNVSFKYNKGKSVLSDINIKVKPGQMIALVGESGVGKTTIVDLLSNYYLPKKGKILIDRKDISKVTLKSLRENIAIVPQEVALFNDTVENNIKYGRAGAMEEEIIAAAKAAHAHKFIQEFPKKYKQLVGERGIKLSTGQKQRVAIARAVLRNPKILILDEATSSLDSATEKLVQDALQNLIKGRTTFVIAHRLSTIQKADQIFVLEKGKIIEEGDHKELVEKGGVYKELCKLQSTVVK